MSDLAPFVASVLRDQNVEELLEENQELRERLATLPMHLKLEITGRDGTPVYYTSSMDQGEPTGSGTLWQVGFPESQEIALDELPNLEVRVGGDVRAKFSSGNVSVDTDVLTDDFDRGNLEELQMGGIMFHFGGDASSTGVFIVYGRFGPVLWEDYIDIPPDYSPFDNLIDLYNRNLASNLVITGVDFLRER